MQHDFVSFSIVTGTLIEAAVAPPVDYGIFQMADCHSVFVQSELGGPSWLADGLGATLRADVLGLPIDTYAPCYAGKSGYQMVFKNVQNCCKPSQLKMIQNRAASSPEQTALNGGKPYSVSGKIDRNYNYNYRQYLKKRCMIADYDNRSGGRQRSAVKYPPSSQQVLEASCCTTTCCKCVHYATYQMDWDTNATGDTFYDAHGNSGQVHGPSGEITTFKMDCVLFALADNGGPYLYTEKGGDVVAKFGTLLSVRFGGCHEQGSHIPSDMLTYKRSNWGFRKQGAVDNGLYIATKKIYANPCCAGKLETDRDPNNPVTPEPPNPQDQNQPKKEEVEVPRPPVLAKEAGKVAKNGGGGEKIIKNIYI